MLFLSHSLFYLLYYYQHIKNQNFILNYLIIKQSYPNQTKKEIKIILIDNHLIYLKSIILIINII